MRCPDCRGQHGRADYRRGQRYSLRHTVTSILDWVEECVERLGPTNAPVVLTMPPTATVTALSQWRYSLIRTCAFPGCRLSRNDAFSRAEQLDAGLQELAARRGLARCGRAANGMASIRFIFGGVIGRLHGMKFCRLARGAHETNFARGSLRAGFICDRAARRGARSSASSSAPRSLAADCATARRSRFIEVA